MSTTTYTPSRHELQLAEILHGICVEEINRREVEDVCARLGLASTGLRRLMWLPNWDLATAVRVADALDLVVLDDLVATISEAVHNQERAAS